ncbi:MAG: DUF624 domain-containing protein [Eubacteriales bacterium]|jgi:uncharacterized membrane protein YesL|nr:DUF624 domain-containing protein [Eubacteriales bacterium]MDD4326980.1 DUF624 domain-containing protein [Eubacteriales bacterium]MDD4717164.1 DUF624 domain-containing protein [Eubacteriales bacterium]
MAGFFGLFDYNKEGPGVYLNEPPKGPFKTFFSILGRKFWKVISVNMMYVVFSLPVLLVAWLAGSQIFPSIFSGLTLDNLEKLLTETSIAESVSNVSQAVSQSVSSIASSGISGSEEAVVQLTPKETAAILFSQINIVFSFALVGLQLLVLGPVHAGITYIFRNYSREEHAFIWGDFKEHLKKNWKQSLLTSLISFLAVIILSTNFVFYSKGDMVNNTFLKGILTGAVAVIFIVFTMMQMYIYPMMITFKLTLKQLYKNSVLLTMARLPWNIGIMLLSILITTALPIAFLFFGGSLGIILGIFYYFFLAFGLNMMLTNFFVYRQLKKYMIDPMNETKTDTNEIDDEEPIFKDTRTEDEIEDGE